MISGLGPNEVRVLEALMRVDTPLSGRAVARVTSLTQSTAQRALVKLREAGLVLAEPAPPSLMYQANPNHVAMPGIRALAQVEEELRSRMAAEVSMWQVPAVSVILYGSVARGESTSRSDIDVLAIRPDQIEPDTQVWEDQLAELAAHVRQWTGRRASVVDMRRSEAAVGVAGEEPFLLAADREGWVIAGQPLHDLVANSR